MLVTVMSLCALADDKVSFTATAPEAVAVGDQFRLSYTVTTQNVRDFRVPSFKGFDVLMGPSPSRQSSVQIINGKTTSTRSITYTYILMATAEGSYTLPAASIVADGEQMLSNAVEIKVLPADKAAASGTGSSQSNGRTGTSRASASSVADSDLFIRATVSKSSVYEQEAFLLTYKIYTLVDLRGFDNVKLPDFKGFHSQEVELPTNRRWSLEHYNGRNYQTTIYRQFVLFPQQAGKLTIEPARFDASVARAMQTIDPFEAFFNGGSNYMEIKKPLVTPRITIDAKPLPAGKPEGFSGGVGDFNISATISSNSVKTNDAVTLKLIISGTGNMKLMDTPEVHFPEEFEIYDPKVDNKFRLTNNGLSGNQVIEYLAIPRTEGDYTIPPVQFSYFDCKSQTYKTLSTEAFPLHVEKGSGDATQVVANFVSKEDLKVLNQDIRYIKLGDVSLSPRGRFFLGSLACWLWYVVPALAFVVLFVLYRKQIAANANLAYVRTKKANKMAVKRLKSAGRLLAEGKQNDFYDEVLKALWGYVADKLSISTSSLTKDNVADKLRQHGVDDTLVGDFLSLLDTCEFARFAPGEGTQGMDKVYAAALDVMGKMENSIKR